MKIEDESRKMKKKARILISAHPLDRHAYLSRLEEGIAACHDVSIVCSPFPSDADTSALDGVSCVVAAVTEKYITWSNGGFVSESMAAIRLGIPIIPIILEDGITNLFNTRFGKYHYIENLSPDITDETISALCRHLSPILCESDATQAEDRPLVFISYRKKDAAQLSRLVDAIRSHPEHDRIALWYDTDLTPGENYSQSITDALRGCALFLMLVTPSILERGNYVMREEYPLALKLGKPILPIMMQRTDLSLLREAFPHIPKCIRDGQIDAIYAKIQQADR